MLVACQTEAHRPESETRFQSPGKIDENEGTYRGVGIGDSAGAIQRVFGRKRPSGENDPGTALRYPDGGDDGPVGISFPGITPASYRYFDVVFFFGRREVGALTVVEPNGSTTRGVRIGDPLSTVRARYPEVRCGTANEDSEYGEYPACQGRLRPHRWIWFGGDPIKSISVGVTAFDGCCSPPPRSD